VTLSIAVIKSRGVPFALQDEALDGGTRNLTETVGEFARQGLSVNIFTSSPAPIAPSVETVDGIIIHRLPVHVDPRHTGIDLDVERAGIFARALLAYPPYANTTFDFLHTHHWTSAAPELLERRRYRSLHLHTPHLLVAEKLRLLGLPDNPRALVIEQSALAMADRIIAVSRSEAEVVSKHYGVSEERVAVIPNGVSREFLANSVDGVRLAERLGSSPLRLVSVGRLARQKGVDILVRAVALALARGLDVRCTVIGGPYHSEPDELPNLIELASKLGVSDHVEFVGQRTTLAVVEMLLASSVYVQPTRYESQGLAILEAMAVGLPVITTRLAAVSEYLRDGVNGILVDPECPEATVEALAFLMGHPELAVAMGSANRELVKPMDWQRACALTIRCLGIAEAR
jgi:glycosyltransferase involved in cell wall biosynthesis